ncbi:integrase core domain-containing protein [bacterium]|nr:integrase core domain-containing protein [bacterium]
MDRLRFLKRTPKTTPVDNGPVFISKVLDRQAYENSITLDFARPGKPTNTTYIEPFKDSFQDECLNVNWFLSLKDTRNKIAARRMAHKTEHRLNLPNKSELNPLIKTKPAHNPHFFSLQKPVKPTSHRRTKNL